ncbi:hypothetical protein RHGRI_024796 [Rhododendron griersonianum]|uniref:SAM domain-containing protein n=1 Tax=Rhododendron griersonianum TaxID=479676 RepID=A0AAV6JD26_9ERIC|nr:hypothetical protein RHGRI_024796 [Rhododendron griersonianum]
MDWFSWLSKTGIDHSLIYEYGLIFTHNELEEDDIAYFNHEFLQSMGIAIAKHRLEILKLARKDRGNNLRSRLFVAIKRTKRSLAKRIQTWVHRDRDSALVLVPKRSHSARWKGAMMKRNSKRLVVPSSNQGSRLLLTNGSSTPMVLSGPRLNSFSSPLMVRGYYNDEEEEKEEEGEEDPYWSAGVEEIRWDAMFQDLKPT